uniref:Uncharacterized protein n=1 Tax=Arion vulgaris TaxID=1028688 RepID=A0A0B7BD94_9EUPU
MFHTDKHAVVDQTTSKPALQPPSTGRNVMENKTRQKIQLDLLKTEYVSNDSESGLMPRHTQIQGNGHQKPGQSSQCCY